MDQGFSQGVIEEKIRYCETKGVTPSELFVKFDGEPFNENPSEWTNKYYATQRTKLRANFCRERLEHLKKVGKKLFPEPQVQAPTPTNSHTSALGGAIIFGAIGAIAGGVIAACASASIIGGILVGGVGGVVVGAGVGTAVGTNKGGR
jgi:hypothetical protein